jgi:purine-binding chemotaxis protein CheW
MLASRQICTFLVDGLCFGIDVRDVQEVIRFQEMTRVPLSMSMVRGLINLRGQIVTAMEMRERLGLTPRPDESRPMNVIVRSDDGPVSLLVDEIGDVIEIDEVQFEEPPERLSVAARDAVAGVYKLENRLLLVLDAAKVVALTAPPAREAIATPG